jgi:UDP-3-O-[3-hydroxymyristoyl] glucosamine N-acyltransferase
MPLPTPGEIKAVAEVAEAALKEVAPGIAAKVTEELTSIYGQSSDIIAQATKGHEKLVAGFEKVIGDFTGSIHPSAVVDKHAFVHPNAIVQEGARILHGASVGDGAVVGKNSEVFLNAKIGDNVTIGNNSFIGQNTEIGRGTVIGDDSVVWKGASADQGLTMGKKAHIGGRAQLGENVTLGDKASVGSENILHKGVVVGEDATLLNKVVVGERSTIGPGASIGKAPSRGGAMNNDWNGATIGADTNIGASTTIGAKATIGDLVKVDDGAFFNQDVVVGNGAKIGKNVVVDRAANIKPGAEIQDGSYVGLRRVVEAGSPWTPESEKALKSAEYATQAAARVENAALKPVAKEIENPFATAEPAEKLETTVVNPLSREDLIKSFEGSVAARARFEKALTRIDEASVRKTEAAQRAESVKADPMARPGEGELKFRTLVPESDSIASIEEYSNGRRIVTEKTEYPIISKSITEEPDGTRMTESLRSTSGDSSLSHLDSTIIEHANGSLERRSVRYVNDEYDIHSGSIEHADGSVEQWHDNTVDFSKVTRFEDKKGVVTSSGEVEEN